MPRWYGWWGTRGLARSVPSQSRSCLPNSCDTGLTRSLGTTRPVCPGEHLAVRGGAQELRPRERERDRKPGRAEGMLAARRGIGLLTWLIRTATGRLLAR